MEKPTPDPGSEKWQRYKEWLINATAGTEYPANAETMQSMYENDLGPWGDPCRCEALAWMNNPVAPGYLAVNRFSREESFAFVDNLYTLGAIGVYVTNLDHRRSNFADSFPHSDTLIMTLPDDATQRRALLDVAAEENFDAPGRYIEDSGQDAVVFWWD